MSISGGIEQVAVGGGATGLSLIGGWHGFRWFIKFITGRHDQRGRDLDERERKLDAQEAAAMEALRLKVASLEDWRNKVSEELENHRVALAILIAKVRRDDPKAPELEQVRRLLPERYAFLLDTFRKFSVADDEGFGEALNRIDAAERAAASRPARGEAPAGGSTSSTGGIRGGSGD